ncbi:MAG: hypothetical protein ACYDBJ_07110 [Aggregatilineales bacterium]
MSRPKRTETVEATVQEESNLSESDLQQQIGHRIRRPLIRIIEQADSLLAANSKASPANTRAGLGQISGEAYRMLDMYDWMLALFELTLKPSTVSKLDPGKLISTVCLEIETVIPAELLGYHLIWSVPDGLPQIKVNGYLLQRTLRLMIRLLGSGLRSSYVQLNVQISDMGLVIQTNTTITDPSLVQLDLENLVLDAVARVCGGTFEWAVVNQRLELTLHLPVAH